MPTYRPRADGYCEDWSPWSRFTIIDYVFYLAFAVRRTFILRSTIVLCRMLKGGTSAHCGGFGLHNRLHLQRQEHSSSDATRATQQDPVSQRSNASWVALSNHAARGQEQPSIDQDPRLTLITFTSSLMATSLDLS
jgi:hypothetical protein